TDLPDRQLFNDRLRQAMIDGNRTGHMVAVMLLDLDRFKTINDSLGHDAGDSLLRQVGQRVGTRLRAGATVAGLGGDEFTILVRDLKDVQNAADVGKDILATLESPFQVSGRELFITASLGISLFPLDDREIDALLKNAEAAMYNAKQEGRNNY